MFSNIFEGENFNNLISNARNAAQLNNFGKIPEYNIINKSKQIYNDYINHLQPYYSEKEFIDNVINLYKNLDNSNIKDFIFNLYFSIPIGKQGFDEKFQIEYLKTNLEKYGIELFKLPVNGPNSYYCDNKGNIVNQRNNKTSKSIDVMFKYKYDSYELLGYGTLKYTKGLYGGLQAEQLLDVKNTLNNFKKNKDINIFTFALLDGKFFNDRLHELDSYTTIKNKVCSSDEIINEIKQYCLYWLNSLNITIDKSELNKFIN